VNSGRSPAIRPEWTRASPWQRATSRLVRLAAHRCPGRDLAMTPSVFVSVFNPFRSAVAEAAADMGNLVAPHQVMDRRICPATRRSAPYELWLKTATQDLTDPDHVESQDVTGQGLDGRSDHRHAGARNGCSIASSNCWNCTRISFCNPRRAYEAPDAGVWRYRQRARDSEDTVDVKLLNGTLPPTSSG